jgi:hypothetical protein
VRANGLLLGVFLGAALGAGGSGCGSSGSGGSTEAKSIKPTPPTQLPPGGLGSYVRAAVPKDDSTALDLTSDGRYSQSFAGQPSVIRGVWRYRNGKITFEEASGKGAACIGRVGSYSWRFSHGRLTLRSLDDPCKFRRRDFAFAQWTRSG